MHQLSTPEQLFSDLLARDPSHPFVTYYDEATGERAELSAKSLGNWVAKTHHLLGTELGLGVGDRAVLALPMHWISLPPLLGCLTAGLELTASDASGASGADVAFVEAGTVSAATGVPDVFAVAADAAAAGFGADPPHGTEDFVGRVRPQEDKWPGVLFGAGPDDPCLPGRTRVETVEWARARAEALGISAGARVLCTRDWAGPDDWVDTVLAPLAAGASVVFVRHCADAEVLARRATQERTTVVVA